MACHNNKEIRASGWGYLHSLLPFSVSLVTGLYLVTLGVDFGLVSKLLPPLQTRMYVPEGCNFLSSVTGWFQGPSDTFVRMEQAQ